ncbi:MAG: TRAP transporter small permease [Desulfovibrionales bacterium]|nr:TRAP transporter small permease [Desulfovibrionales bacterium]
MSKFITWLDQWGEEFFVSIMLSFLIILLGMEVVSRFITHHSFPWVEEVCRYLFIWSSYLGVAIAVKHKEQIRVLMMMDLIDRRFPKIVKVLFVISELVFAAFCIFVFYYSIGMIQNMMRFKQVSSSLEIDTMYPYLIIPISMILTAFRTLQSLRRDLKFGTLHFEARGD